jgi:hypothetical protein
MSNDKPSQMQQPGTIDLPELSDASDPSSYKSLSSSPQPKTGGQNYPVNRTQDSGASGTGQGATGSTSSSGSSSTGGGSPQYGSGGAGTSGGGSGNP